MNFILTEATPMILLLVMGIRIYQMRSDDDDGDSVNGNDVNESALPNVGVGQPATLEKTSTNIYLSFSAIFLISNIPSCFIEILDLFEAEFQVKILR
jgi:hypothetical protein